MCVTDKDGTVIPDFCDEVKLTLENATVLGIGNGNPNSHHFEKGNSINFFNGYAQVIVNSNGGRVTAVCNNLTDSLEV